MALLSVNEQFGVRGRAPGEFTILWPALRALVEAGKFHGETAGGVMEKPTSFHHETAGGSTKKLTSFHGETSLPPSSASDLSASDPPNTHEGVQKSGHDDSPTADQAQALYAAYPRKIARGAALKAIERALRDTDFETLMEAVRVFANSSAGRAGKFCPYPSTWFNRRQWEDDRGVGPTGHPEKGIRPDSLPKIYRRTRGGKMISVREYATLHATLFATYDRATTDPQLEIWYEALKDLDLDALKAAVAAGLWNPKARFRRQPH